ncbi:gamma-D-glutamyl-meso-diaminopimelate peptidase [Cytobacillus depressus]|uniref:Gamma-D-glutamyl-meso-diaminopimelate peptidase n=1 Tax=Cytobacillus depressus TaxID=1602942 RepID=A0A6L3V8H3_9BACI|nr:M14 family zinc carboxypeptidase [Cytobacillus depressus]KAB2336721.1 gamma-D-glutamyl-meso-diaminopimelate peptidase [Cytobacillus depressus]
MKFQKLLISFAIIIVIFIVNPSESQAANIVNPKQIYTYEVMVRDIEALAARYPHLISYKTIGSSEYGRPIYAVSLGTGDANLFINGSHHAREWISTNLNMYMLEQYVKMYEGNQTYGGYNVKDLLGNTTIWFVPMVNPDGVTLQQSGLSKFPKDVHSSLIKMNMGSTNFKRWKANGKGIDLNRQYNVDWANIKNNASSPSWKNYKGSAPEQASEVKALVKFTKEIDPEMTISYHTSGEILYWNYHHKRVYERNYAQAKKISQLTGYSLVKPGPYPAGGGYADWFVAKYKRPGVTPELGRYAGDTNVPLSEFDRIWNQNKYMGLYAASESNKLYLARGGKPKPKEVSVNIDSQLIKFDQSALLMDGSTLVPIRGVFEHLGATVEWIQATNTIRAKSGSTNIELKVGSKLMLVDGKSITLGVAPQVINNRTLIPLRAVSEALGAYVSWDGATSTVYIISPPIKEVEPPPAKDEDTLPADEQTQPDV